MPNPHTTFDTLLNVSRDDVATATGNAAALALADDEMEALAVRVGSALTSNGHWWNAVAEAAHTLFDIEHIDGDDAWEPGD